MALLLGIETSTNSCSVALHQNEKLLAGKQHFAEKSHASLLPGIAENLLKEAGVAYRDLDGVAVSAGPGSYTGLRVGAASAKAFCYALEIPLLAVGTLDIMVAGVMGRFKGVHYLCPMLDARRMEVYTKLADHQANEIRPACAVVPDPHIFAEWKEPVYVFGNGMPKFRNIAFKKNLIFVDGEYPDARHMGRPAYRKFQQSLFENIVLFEPYYLKKWQTTTRKKSLF